MYCIKCNSPRVIRFLDGFGEWRIFCKNCYESIPLLEFSEAKNVKRLWEFTENHEAHPIKLGVIHQW